MKPIGKTGKIVFTRFLENEDLAESIKRQAEMNGIKAGYFIIIGSLTRAALGYYKDGKYDTIRLEGPLEVASCTGNIVVDEKGEIVVHAHIVVSNEKCEAFGGHLMKGSVVGATAESVMAEAQGVEIQKVYDEKTKLKLWKLG
jgi:hypothetical protein